MQEVRISTTHLPYPLCGVLLSYQQALKATSRDSLTLATLNEQKPVTIEINDITRFEVLPTRLMTPAHAYQQMKEMERIVGL